MSLSKSIRRLIATLITLGLARFIGNLLPEEPAQEQVTNDYADFFADLEDFETLPPPPNAPQREGALHAAQQLNLNNALPVLVLYPNNIDLETLSALSIVDPEAAEQERWRLLRRMKIQQLPETTPVDAWLEHTRKISDNPYVSLEAILSSPTIGPIGKRWIRFLIGVEEQPPPQ